MVMMSKNGDGLQANKDVDQKFLGRIYLKDRMSLLLREAVYHRSFREDESLPVIPIWKLDDGDSGSSIR